MSVFSKCGMHIYISSGDPAKIQIISRFGWDPRFHISNKLQSDADANELRSSL